METSCQENLKYSFFEMKTVHSSFGAGRVVLETLAAWQQLWFENVTTGARTQMVGCFKCRCNKASLYRLLKNPQPS